LLRENPSPTFGAAIAEYFRSGDAFPIDAASPTAASGWDTAIMKSFNLAWKMGWLPDG
jgi:hypothetical protein